MSLRRISWRQLAAVGAVSVLGACAQSPPQTATVAPPVWYHVNFDTNSYALNETDQKIVADLSSYLQLHPAAIATIVGRTDTVGSNEYNMHLSHQRADAVRDAVVYGNKIASERVETRWSGESRPDVATADNVAAAANRVVDVAVH